VVFPCYSIIVSGVTVLLQRVPLYFVLVIFYGLQIVLVFVLLILVVYLYFSMPVKRMTYQIV